MVKAGIPLSEVLTWDVEDILKFLAVKQREEDATAAYHAYILSDSYQGST